MPETVYHKGRRKSEKEHRLFAIQSESLTFGGFQPVSGFHFAGKNVLPAVWQSAGIVDTLP